MATHDHELARRVSRVVEIEDGVVVGSERVSG
jgi:ABC-type lipoprotein export system ATPase subunit